MRVLALAVLLILLVATMEQTLSIKGKTTGRPNWSGIPSDKSLRSKLAKCSGGSCGIYRWCYYSSCFYSQCASYASTFSIGSRGYYFGRLHYPTYKTTIRGFMAGKISGSRKRCATNYFQFWIFQRAPCNRLIIKSSTSCVKNCRRKPYHIWNER